MIDRILRLNGLFFTEIWTNNVTVTFYCFYLRKGTWRFHLYDGNYKITVLLGTAQARGGGGGGGGGLLCILCGGGGGGGGGGGLLSHIIGGGAAFFLVSLTAVFVSSRITKRLKTLTLWPMPPPRPPHGWDFRGRSRLLVIGKIQWLFFDLYPKSFTGACGPLHPYVWGSGRKVG